MIDALFLLSVFALIAAPFVEAFAELERDFRWLEEYEREINRLLETIL